MRIIVIGNALCFVGSVFMVLAGFLRAQRKILVAQCVQNAIFAVGDLLLGGISGTIINCACILRNLICVKWRMNVWLKLFFIAVQAGLTWLWSDNSFVMWLPVIVNCYFTWIIDTENMVHMKIVLILSSLCWAIYDYSIRNYVTVPMDIASVVTNLVALIRLLRGRETIQG